LLRESRGNASIGGECDEEAFEGGHCDRISVWRVDSKKALDAVKERCKQDIKDLGESCTYIYKGCEKQGEVREMASIDVRGLSQDLGGCRKYLAKGGCEGCDARQCSTTARQVDDSTVQYGYGCAAGVTEIFCIITV